LFHNFTYGLESWKNPVGEPEEPHLAAKVIGQGAGGSGTGVFRRAQQKAKITPEVAEIRGPQVLHLAEVRACSAFGFV